MELLFNCAWASWKTGGGVERREEGWVGGYGFAGKGSGNKRKRETFFMNDPPTTTQEIRQCVHRENQCVLLLLIAS